MIERKKMERSKTSSATSIIRGMPTFQKMHSSETQDHIRSIAGVELLLCIQLLNLCTSVMDPSQFRHCWKGSQCNLAQNDAFILCSCWDNVCLVDLWSFFTN
jgi:hypothetical protein